MLPRRLPPRVLANGPSRRFWCPRAAPGSWPRPPAAIPHARLVEPPAGARVTVAGLVLLRQRPGTAKGVIFVTLEDETGVANVVVWAQVFERFRRAGHRRAHAARDRAAAARGGGGACGGRDGRGHRALARPSADAGGPHGRPPRRRPALKACPPPPPGRAAPPSWAVDGDGGDRRRDPAADPDGAAAVRGGDKSRGAFRPPPRAAILRAEATTVPDHGATGGRAWTAPAEADGRAKAWLRRPC